MIYPWQQKLWENFSFRIQSNQLPHALLFSGITGMGKSQFALHLIQTLLCHHKNKDHADCNCRNCHLIQTKVHPNLLWVTSEKKDHAIKIDQVRAVSEFCQQSSLSGEYKMAVLCDAHTMNRHSANALLKTLEEPSSQTILCLITDQYGLLPATIKSRCQRIEFHTPEHHLALTWLQKKLGDTQNQAALLLSLARGAPLKAFEMTHDDTLSVRDDIYQSLYSLIFKKHDPIQLALKLMDTVTPIQLIDFILSWLMDLLRLQLNTEDKLILNQDYQSQLKELIFLVPSKRILSLFDYIKMQRQQLVQGINLNKQLLLESIFIQWAV